MLCRQETRNKKRTPVNFFFLKKERKKEKIEAENEAGSDAVVSERAAGGDCEGSSGLLAVVRVPCLWDLLRQKRKGKKEATNV